MALPLAALALAAAACGGSSGGTATPPASTGGATSTGAEAPKVKEGGILRVGSTSNLDSINPFVAFNAASYLNFTMTYPTLVQYDENFKIVGDWAEKWETSPDGLVWTFHVKPGKWSDGTPLTAEDAAWTGATIIKYADTVTASLSNYIAHATKVEAPDPATVVITYEKPVANVLPQLQQFFIFPKHVWEQHAGHDGKDLKDWDPASALPIVGGGSFYTVKYDKKGTTIIQKNPGYYGTAPHVDAVGFTFYEKPDAMVAAYKSGQLDVIDTVPYTLADQFKADPKTTLQTGDNTLVYDFGFNSNPKKTKHRELLDPKVKEAFSHAVDRDAIVKTVFNGYAKPAYSLLTPIAAPFLNTDLGPEAYDLAMANSQLEMPLLN